MENNSFGFQETKFGEVTQPKPNNYMALSVVATILGLCYCFGIIGGIVAIVMSSQSSTKYLKGDYEGAVKAAKVAKIISLIVLVLFALQVINLVYNINQMGGWDAYMLSIQEAVEAIQENQ